MEVELNMALVTCIGSFVMVIVGALSVAFFVKKATGTDIDAGDVGAIVSGILTIPFVISFLYLFHGLISKIPI